MIIALAAPQIMIAKLKTTSAASVSAVRITAWFAALRLIVHQENMPILLMKQWNMEFV